MRAERDAGLREIRRREARVLAMTRVLDERRALPVMDRDLRAT